MGLVCLHQHYQFLIWKRIAGLVCHHDKKPLFINVVLHYHVVEPTFWFNRWFCMLIPFLDVCWSEIVIALLDCWMSHFLKYWCNMLHVMLVAWDGLWTVFLSWKDTSWILPFKSSGESLIFLPNPDFDVSWEAYLPMTKCFYFIHSVCIITLLTVNFRLICSIKLMIDLTISRIQPHKHDKIVGISFLPWCRLFAP